ncbi:MAG TPA: glycogen-binding domain-containing protein [Gemmatimonadales bacterium]|nr:glycogen-binding domain-containing protein [Gemmatimonadales bacterium]
MSAAMGCTGAALIAAFVALAPRAEAQEWRATVQVGRVTSEAAAPGAAANASLVVGLARHARRDWLSLSSALPVNGDPFWASAGAGKRVATPGAVGLLADVSVHGFVQRFTTTTQSPAPSPSPLPIPGSETVTRNVSVSGWGAGAEGLGGIHAGRGALHIEVRGGATGQRSELDGASVTRILPTADARFTLARLPVVLGAETRAWWHEAERHTYAGGSLRLVEGPLQLWGSAGQWLSDGVPDVVWGAGARVEIGPMLELHVAARGNGFDPVYSSRSGRSVAAGMSVRFGRAAELRAPVPASYTGGRAEVRIPARSVEGQPSIAGDFTGWKAVAMVREGGRWVWRGDLAPGTYHYAFVAADGTWFVPESVPGRRDDGMGGHVAVLVVTS